MKRRDFLRSVAAAPILVTPLAHPSIQMAQATAAAPPKRVPIKQSVMSSVWGNFNNNFEERCKVLQRIWFKGVDLPTEANIPIMAKYGLSPTMMTGPGTSFQNGLIRKELHETMETGIRTGIDTCARVGCPNLIVLP